MKSRSGPDSIALDEHKELSVEELDAALSVIWKELSLSGPTGRPQGGVEEAVEQFRTAAAELLSVADQTVAELRASRELTRQVLDRLEARLAANGQG